MWILIGFHFILLFFKKLKKKKKKVFLYGILSALLKKKKLDREKKIYPWKFSKITENAKKTLLFSAATWIAFLA